MEFHFCSTLLLLLLFLNHALVDAAGLDPLAVMNDEFEFDQINNYGRVWIKEEWPGDQMEVIEVKDGDLLLQPKACSWYNDRRGPLLYQEVDGDFIMHTSVSVTGRASSSQISSKYSLAGLMVRAPRNGVTAANWTPGGENYVFLSIGSADTPFVAQTEVKTTTNSSSLLSINDTPMGQLSMEIQIARLGAHYILLRKFEGGDWEIVRRYNRQGDALGDAFLVQAGITAYTDWDTVNSIETTAYNNMVISGGNPDLNASFEFLRYATPRVPEGFNIATASDEDLLSFLGANMYPPLQCFTGITGVLEDDFPEFLVDASFVYDAEDYLFSVNVLPDVFTPPNLVQAGYPVSGWDIEYIVAYYDVDEDKLYFAISCYAICGDADGDGSAGVTSQELLVIGGTDAPSFGGTETVLIALDFTLDDVPDFVLGYPGEVADGSEAFPAPCTEELTGPLCFGLYRYASSSWILPFQQFKYVQSDSVLQEPSTYATDYNPNPTASRPGLEWSIDGLDALLTRASFSSPLSSPETVWAFRMLAYAGSKQDSGIGDDYVPAFDTSAYVEMVAPNLFGKTCAAELQPFTGNVDVDFPLSDPAVIHVSEGSIPDVAIPQTLANAGFEISGYDIEYVAFRYRELFDVLEIGVKCFVICGDADGDGDADRTSPELAALGGVDEAMFSNTESMLVAFDFGTAGNPLLGPDGVLDYMIGYPAGFSSDSDTPACNAAKADKTCFGLYEYAGTTYSQPQFRFRWKTSDPVLGNNPKQHVTDHNPAPTVDRPHLEWTLNDFFAFRTAAGFSSIDGSWFFNFMAFAGAFDDDGIGEDFLPLSIASMPAVDITPVPTVPSPRPTAAPSVAPTTAPYTVNGNVDVDFAESDPQVVRVMDIATKDVGLPDAVKQSGALASGYDIEYIAFRLDRATDVFEIGIRCFVICGDADDNGDADSTGSALAALGGIDYPNFAQSESFLVAFDFDNNNLLDYIVGYPAAQAFDSEPFPCGLNLDISCFGLYQYSGSTFSLPDQRFRWKSGDEVLGLSALTYMVDLNPHPDAEKPHLYWNIIEFSVFRQRAQFSPIGSAAWSFRMLAYAGSFDDDGIGEDFLPAGGLLAVQMPSSDATAAPTPPTPCELLGCQFGFGFVNSSKWCACCQNDCGNYRDLCIEINGFCQPSGTCYELKYGCDIPTPSPTDPLPTVAPTPQPSAQPSVFTPPPTPFPVVPSSPFQGNVDVDFPESDVLVVRVVDVPAHDVGLPSSLLQGNLSTSGYDIEFVAFRYGYGPDRLEIGIACYVICGDADGDGSADTTSPVLQSLGGIDYPQFSQSESVLVAFDFNEDDQLDYLIGYPASKAFDSDPFPCGVALDTTCFGIYQYSGAGYAVPQGRFRWKVGDEVIGLLPNSNAVDHNPAPTLERPHLEWSITHFSAFRERAGLIAITRPWSFKFLAFAGSFDDAGITDDFVPSSGNLAIVQMPNPNSSPSPTSAPTAQPSRAPTTTPTPAPTTLCDKCRAINYGIIGSNPWCECCQQDCDGRLLGECALKGFCEQPFRCVETPYCDGYPFVPTPEPTPSPVEEETECTALGCHLGFGFTGSPKWCQCCALDCQGFLSTCISAGAFCEPGGTCLEAQYNCSVPTMAPTPTPTPQPTEQSQCEVLNCSTGFGFTGSDKWCGCCANDCDGLLADCIEFGGFCAVNCREAQYGCGPGTPAPTHQPTAQPSSRPTLFPTPIPPTRFPTPFPTAPGQTPEPSFFPTPIPPTRFPTPIPPTRFPTPVPSPFPTRLPTPQPSIMPTPMPVGIGVCESQNCQFGFGVVGSPKWCGCCAFNCSGLQAECMNNYGFCQTGGVCLDGSYGCTATPTLSPTVFPTPSPTDSCGLYNCDSSFGVTGSPQWCHCCYNNCSGQLSACIEFSGFCQAGGVCLEAQYGCGPPTLMPTPLPTLFPSPFPTPLPSPFPSPPTRFPTAFPTGFPTREPTPVPSVMPTPRPSSFPTFMPTELPTRQPTPEPTSFPSHLPTPFPSWQPTPAPSPFPSHLPTPLPTSAAPTRSPVPSPTRSPTPPTLLPTAAPTQKPSQSPTAKPSNFPTFMPSPFPSNSPTVTPTWSPSPPPSPALPRDFPPSGSVVLDGDLLLSSLQEYLFLRAYASTPESQIDTTHKLLLDCDCIVRLDGRIQVWLETWPLDAERRKRQDPQSDVKEKTVLEIRTDTGSKIEGRYDQVEIVGPGVEDNECIEFTARQGTSFTGAYQLIIRGEEQPARAGCGPTTTVATTTVLTTTTLSTAAEDEGSTIDLTSLDLSDETIIFLAVGGGLICLLIICLTVCMCMCAARERQHEDEEKRLKKQQKELEMNNQVKSFLIVDSSDEEVDEMWKKAATRSQSQRSRGTSYHSSRAGSQHPSARSIDEGYVTPHRSRPRTPKAGGLSGGGGSYGRHAANAVELRRVARRGGRQAPTPIDVKPSYMTKKMYQLHKERRYDEVRNMLRSATRADREAFRGLIEARTVGTTALVRELFNLHRQRRFADVRRVIPTLSPLERAAFIELVRDRLVRKQEAEDELAEYDRSYRSYDRERKRSGGDGRKASRNEYDYSFSRSSDSGASGSYSYDSISTTGTSGSSYDGAYSDYSLSSSYSH